MSTVKERIKACFSQVLEVSPEIADDAVEYLIEQAKELDEAGGLEHLRQVVEGVVPLAKLREAVETCMCREAFYMVDAMRGIVKGVDKLNPDDITHYFKIQALYNSLNEAGML